ncbi:LlaJI family restriction endonuclease [Bacillus pseudomycoides]|uniref:LlaJI family restriction endonuclease n=1 Tax=Bacillus pseudomycoides TaxID=64104 RepID=UPI0015D47192|nr:LlaJI family restriction endonuclease [Bacillus pseudomycoides]
MNEPKFFIEYEWITLNTPVPQNFYELGLCEKQKNQIRFKFVGFSSYKENLFIVFPKGFQLSKDINVNKKKAKLLLQTLIKYEKSTLKSHFLGDGDDVIAQSFSNITRLIEDYQNFGIIKFQERKQEINGKGRINWGKTIKQTQPYMQENVPLYLNLITSRTQFFSEHEISYIHEYVLHHISLQFGWLFDLEFYPNNIEALFNTELMIHILTNALSQTFVEREIQLFKELINYLKKMSQEDSSTPSIYATQYFHNIWELMCAQIFEDDESLHKLVPNPYWIVDNKEYETKQIPDILFTKNHELYVLDAKYYRIKEGLDKLPGWKDIVKQLFYAQSFKNNGFPKNNNTFQDIHNIFLFPSTRAEKIRHFGFAAVKGLEDKHKGFGKILAFELDVEFALSAYVHENETNLQNKLLNSIAELN